MYNVKLFNYVGGQQLKLYKVPIKKGRKIDRKDKKVEQEQLQFNLQNGQIVETEKIKNMEKKEKEKKEKSVYNSLIRSKNKIYSVARSVDWDYFITLTFNKEVVNRYSYTECSNKLKNWLDRYRRTCKDLKYVIVPEQHKDGAWHFHALISDGDYTNFVDSGKKSEDDIIYNINNYNLGFTTATKVKDSSKVSGYICKYITKDIYSNIPLGKKRYWFSRNIKIQEFEFMATKEQMENYKKSEELTYIKKLQNEYNTITYLELNPLDAQKNKEIKEVKQKEMVDYIKNLLGEDTEIEFI